MRALVLREGQLLVDDVPEPRPGPGQMAVEPLATGICGSDLSAWQHTDEFLQASIDSDTEIFIFDKSKDLVMGHEFSSRVLEVGPGVTAYQPGDLIVTVPMAVDPAGGTHCVGYATDYPGALSERVVVQAEVNGAALHPRIPNGFDPYLAALTEPLTVGFNAVARSRITPEIGAVVIGCGPVGLGAVVGLLERGVGPVVVSDPSPSRRALAAEHGAHVVVDPTEEDPIAVWRRETGGDKRLYVFENSGIKGMLNQLLYTVPHSTRILVSGSCMVDDTIRPVVGIYKNIRIDFCMGPDVELGATPVNEFALTLQRLAEGRVDGRRLVTGYASLAASAKAFEALRPTDPHAIEHFKVLVRHDLTGDEIIAPERLPDATPGRT
jgi:threonine dehydrogenase-like Zn-dependent dehydrogenase